MTDPNQLPDETSLSPTNPSQNRPRHTSGLKAIFIGPDGLRAGWRMLLFLVHYGVLFGAFVLIRHGGPQGVVEAQRRMAHMPITPRLLGVSEAVAFACLCFATWIMGRLERRPFSAYGLPPHEALRKGFWLGAGSGFLAISGTLLAMFLLHGFRITGLALHGTAIVTALGAWGVAFLLVGLFEEFALRGYLQYTLASAIGFWPAAFVLSGLFGFAHAFNPGENAVGAVSAGLFGLLFCLVLRRTGSLWFAVGFHAAWDWAQTLYGVPDSGMLPYHNLFNSAFHGPRWLTGGSVGPEGSILTPIALLIVALIFNRYYRENRYRQLEAQPISQSSVKAA